MKVGYARAAAAEWVARNARTREGFAGAYFHGSTTGLADGADLPVSSDVDVVVVIDTDKAPPKPGKLRHRGALLEITYEPFTEIASAERVLSSYHVAGGFVRDTVIEDPTGHLASLHARVARDFGKQEWVRARCADARLRVERRLAAMDFTAPFHEQVTGWLFPTGVSTHVVLVAALRNPTIRLRYVAARRALSDFDRLDRYPELLELLGCERLSADTVRDQLASLTRTFDATTEVARTPFPFSSDLTREARAIAIDGSRDLIDGGLHREAVFWIIATFARCHTALATDAPALHRALLSDFEAAVATLGITSPDDLRHRRADVTAFLPRLDKTAEDIMRRLPDSTD
ncbi:hypothetical protein [Streptomyces tsukubensis]|uniref:Polymerase nucleotidyl transferase domain-containing protein n=1 Tax=Streptomyces tsukubensis TaxID=83656 RepID=A0A1V4A6Z3_9ACTN|nr:hypothetical protein [Streptomyces tsukubensis]OON77282.1 hypothetical protein B1H18_18695 [Streptomyces tsukubensis]QFR92357.1 hypothetical protein GBW32_03920 [Streptomyces tsukubensis]